MKIQATRALTQGSNQSTSLRIGPPPLSSKRFGSKDRHKGEDADHKVETDLELAFRADDGIEPATLSLGIRQWQ
jgi:hypothetical protein